MKEAQDMRSTVHVMLGTGMLYMHTTYTAAELPNICHEIGRK